MIQRSFINKLNNKPLMGSAQSSNQKSLLNGILNKSSGMNKENYFEQIFDKESEQKHSRFQSVKYSTRDARIMLVSQCLNAKSIESWEAQLDLYNYRRLQNPSQQFPHYRDRVEDNFRDVEQSAIVLPITWAVPPKWMSICGTGEQVKIVNIIMPKYTSDLSYELEKRSHKNKYYSEEELWLMLHSIVVAGLELHELGLKYWLGTVHPRNLFLNDQGKVGIMPWFAFPEELNVVYKWHCKGSKSVFISPESIDQLNDETFIPESYIDGLPNTQNRHKCDAFALGMTILSLATLQPDMGPCYKGVFVKDSTKKSMGRSRSKSTLQQVNKNQRKRHMFNSNIDYDLREQLQTSKELSKTVLYKRPVLGTPFNTTACCFDPVRVRSLTHQMSERYSPLLRLIVEKLVDSNPSTRISFRTLYREVLQPYQKDILYFEANWWNRAEDSRNYKFQNSGSPSYVESKYTHRSPHELKNEPKNEVKFNEQPQFIQPIQIASQQQHPYAYSDKKHRTSPDRQFKPNVTFTHRMD